MASANYDALHVRLSRMLGDPVAAASTDGKVWTSARRDILLNNAVRRWMLESAEKQNWNALQEFIEEESEALTNNEVAFSSFTGDVFEVIWAKNTTKGVPIRRMPEFVDEDDNSYFEPDVKDQWWKREGTNFKLIDGESTTGDTVRLRYVKKQPDMTNAYASDIMVPSQYFGIILDYALELGIQEKPDPEKYPVLQDKAQEKVPTGVIGDK